MTYEADYSVGFEELGRIVDAMGKSVAAQVLDHVEAERQGGDKAPIVASEDGADPAYMLMADPSEVRFRLGSSEQFRVLPIGALAALALPSTAA